MAMLAAALAALAWLDVSTGGEANPQAALGELGTPVRKTYVAPTPVPPGVRLSPTPRPTFSAGAAAARGTASERDFKRREDLLLLLDAANKLKARDGAYPSTTKNVQTLCKYKEADTGCKLKEIIGGELPADPLGNELGYWYQSDGETIKIYASLEGTVPVELLCPTSDEELKKHSNLICITAP
ncbi:MAG: hypothetical protein HY874_00870 [Chloroflexi bacterium]|nr:hypothetical protein [Chloroflexota bacterium]